jgi:glycerate-2-kinase
VSADLAPVANAASLLDHGALEARRIALDVLAAGWRAADPRSALDRLLDVDGSVLRVGGRAFDLAAARSVVVLGAGKASAPIAAAIEGKVGDHISRGLVVRRAGGPGALRHVELIEADHPVPSAASLEAGRRLAELADSCGPGDLVITVFTGGSSALASLPPDGVSFAAKQRLHALLVDSGASIGEINAVRKHVSAIKGGRLAARMRGATIINLTLSDVVGNAVDLICDVTVQDTTDVAAAITVLKRHELWDEVAAEVRRHLESGDAESPSLAEEDITTHVLVTGSTVAREMASRARALGATPVVLGSRLEGDAAGLGGLLGALSVESAQHGEPFAPGSVLIGAGGETTVTVDRRASSLVGCGGPNQEVALGFARAVASAARPIAGVFVDSDGSDGGTDAAGGCVDHTSFARAGQLGVDIDLALARHDSSAALRRLGDLVVTGPTETNISDLVVVAIGSADGADAHAKAAS